MNSPGVFADLAAQRACWHPVAFASHLRFDAVAVAYRKAMRDLGPADRDDPPAVLR